MKHICKTRLRSHVALGVCQCRHWVLAGAVAEGHCSACKHPRRCFDSVQRAAAAAHTAGSVLFGKETTSWQHPSASGAACTADVAISVPAAVTAPYLVLSSW